MDLRSRLRAIVAPLPPGAAVTLPVEVVRTWLEVEGVGDTPVDLTVQEVGDLLGRAPSTVRTWCGAGRLPGAYRLRGREWRIPRGALRALRQAGGGQGEPGDDEVPDLGRWRRVIP